MKILMHSLSTMHCNVKTEIRVAKETGYDGIELMVSKVLRYLDSGYRPESLLPLFEQYDIWPLCMNALQSIEVQEPAKRQAMLMEAERVCEAADIWGCPTIQLVPLLSLADKSWDEVRRLTANNIRDIADIGKHHGVRFQLELIAFSPIHTLSQALEVINEVERDNVAMVIDFWHLYAGGGTKLSDVARLDKSNIYGVHFCDGKTNPEGSEWDELALRSYRPGEGQIPIQEWVDAVLSTGYDGTWSPELCSPPHWEWDLWDIARTCKKDMERYLKK